MEGARRLDLQLSLSLPVDPLPLLSLPDTTFQQGPISPARKKRRLSQTTVPVIDDKTLKIFKERLDDIYNVSKDLLRRVKEFKDDLDITTLISKIIKRQEKYYPMESPEIEFLTQEYERKDEMLLDEKEVSLEEVLERVNQASAILKESENLIDKFEEILKPKEKKESKEARPEKRKRSEDESGSGSWSVGAMGSQILTEERVLSTIESCDGRRDFIANKIVQLTKRITLWQIKQWEKKEFNKDEIRDLLKSSEQMAQVAQAREKKANKKPGLTQFTSPPPSSMTSEKRGDVGIVTGVSKGKSVNQDNFISEEIYPGIFCYAVADGHGRYGERVSGAIAKEFPQILKKVLKDVDIQSEDALKNALKAAYSLMDQVLEEQRIPLSGSTFLCVLRTPFSFTFANVGDSRAVFDIGGVAKQMTVDQNTHEPYFVEEVKLRGAEVKKDKWGKLRVYPAESMVTKDMGVHELKIVDEDQEADKYLKLLSSTPEIYSCTIAAIKSGDSHLIIASDGLWGHSTSDQAVVALRKRLKLSKDTQVLAQDLFAGCYHAGGEQLQDDTTILIIPF